MEAAVGVKLSQSTRRSLANIFPLLQPRLALDCPDSIVLQFPREEFDWINESLIPIGLACNDKRFRINNVIPVHTAFSEAFIKHAPDAADDKSSEPAQQPIHPDTVLTVQLSSDQRIAISVLFPDWASTWKVEEEASLAVELSADRFQFVRNNLIPYAISCDDDVMQQNLTDAFIEMWSVFPVYDICTE